jgi:hypothetical protein
MHHPQPPAGSRYLFEQYGFDVSCCGQHCRLTDGKLAEHWRQ